MKQKDWDTRWMNLAIYVGGWSKDHSQGVGAVIVNEDNRVISMGYNGLPSGAIESDEERHERPLKYMYTEHAERNAIYNASRIGVSTKGCTMYLHWFPCSDCARAIIQSGITRLVCPMADVLNPRWGGSFMVALELLHECDVEVSYYKP